MARRFRFRLQTLLRVRELREREAQRKVGLKQGEIARLEQLNRQTAQEILAHQQTLREQQNLAKLAPGELARGRAWITYLRGTIVERQAIRAELQQQLDALRSDWRRARTQKRVIETLRERRWAEYTKDRARREQADSEELARALHGAAGTAENDAGNLT